MSKSTPIRLIRTSSDSYNFLEIQLLEESFNYGLLGIMSSIGSITFQQTKGETEWYGMRYVLNTDRFKDLNLFNIICKKINKLSDYKSQPNDIINIINGKEYFLYNQEFFKESDKGKECFSVKQNDVNYSRLVAKNLKEANMKLDKYVKSIRNRSNNYVYSIGDSFLIK